MILLLNYKQDIMWYLSSSISVYNVLQKNFLKLPNKVK